MQAHHGEAFKGMTDNLVDIDSSSLTSDRLETPEMNDLP